MRLGLRPLVWHRPVLWMSLAMAVLVVVCLIGLLIDHRTLTGAPIWAKPLKFSISVLVYSLTLAWLLPLLRRRWLAWWIGTAAMVALAVEMVVIVGAAWVGVPSHFNVATSLASVLWSVMAFSIVVVWLATLLLAFLLVRADLGDPARSLAIRSGALIAVVGMGLAFLMTGPTADQLDSFQGIAGAHTVGVPDGGPGLPLLGWSTVAGDLRIPHFVGMHALQVLPLAALLLEVAARRLPVFRDPMVRLRLLWVSVVFYLGVLALLTGQALAGQSIVRPDLVIATIAVGLCSAAAVSYGVVVGLAARRKVVRGEPAVAERKAEQTT
ncbi:MAG: hypothetical protein H7311_08755 [Ramlibacter sp.]|nr:hypothetical protein [Cryobacterium sp.]